MPSFKCRDVGFKDSFEVKHENKDELMKHIALHAKEAHNITEITPDLKEKIEKAIKK